MNAERTCPSCGEVLAQEDAFCVNCGARVQDRDLTALASRRRRMADSSLVDGKCRSCNGPLRSTDVFCPECGARRDPTTGASTVQRSGSFRQLRQRLEEVAGDEFEVLEELGRGGMGAVYLARERALDRPVAIKVLFPKFLADENMLERFRNEARIVAALRHPAIVGLHAVRNLEDLHFFVMDFIEGASLEKIVRTHGPLPVPVVKAVLYQVGSALAYAHRQGKGVIHRDIKPSNVMLDTEGTAVVMDFGISKAVNRSQGLTMTGAIIGTPEYMSPEQCRGDTLTTASDQYSLGLVAYAMLTGRPPFSGPHYAVLLAHLTEVPGSIRETREDCPDEVEAAVLKMLAKAPEDRFPDIRTGIKALGGRPLEHGDPLREEIAVLVREAGGASHKATVVAEVSISHPPRKVVPGDRFVLEATPMDELGKELDDRDVEWASTDPGIIQIAADGSFEALAEGKAWLKAVCEGREAAVEVVVTRAPVAALQLAGAPTEIRPGDRARIQATPVDGSGAPLAGREIKWSSSDAGVAFVTASGSVEAVGPGRTEITAECEGVRATLDLHVLQAAVARIWLSAAPAVLHPGDEFTLDVAVLDRKGVRLEGRHLAWDARPPGIVEVRGDGGFVAVAEGDAEIVAHCEGREASTFVGILPEPGATLGPTRPPEAPVSPPQDDLGGWPGGPGAPTILTPRLPEPADTDWESHRIGGSEPATPRRTEAGKKAPLAVRETSRRSSSPLWIWAGGVAVVAIVVLLVWPPGGGPPTPAAQPERSPVTETPQPPAGQEAEAGGGRSGQQQGAERERVPAPREAVTLGLTPAEASLVVGDSIRLTAVARDADGGVVQAAGLTWSLASGSRSGIVRVRSNGVVVALSPGTATVAARAGSLSTGARVVVRGAPAPQSTRPSDVPVRDTAPAPTAPVLVGVTVQGDARGLGTGQERTFRATGRGSDGRPFPLADSDVRWRSSRPAVLEVVSGGRVRGRSGGSAWVVATAGGYSDSVRVEVTATVATVTIGSAPSRLTPGQSAQLDAVVRDGGGTTLQRPVAWRSSAPAVLSVDPGSGQVTARASGSAYIVASVDGVADSVSVEVAAAAAALSADRASALAGGYAALLRSRDADRIQALAGSVDGAHRDLLSLVREDSRGLEVGEVRDVQIVAQEGSNATMRFVVPLRWKGNFGENRSDDASFEAALDLRDGAWVLASCRLTQPISY